MRSTPWTRTRKTRPRTNTWRTRINRRKCCTRWRLHARCSKRTRKHRRGSIHKMTNKLITTTSRKVRALRLTALGLTVALSAVFAQAADARKEAKLDIATGGTVTIVNNTGSVILHSDGGRQVLVAYTTHSDKVEV